jgi:uncharacterized membrane protein
MTHNATAGGNAYWSYAVMHHTEIMAGLIIISLLLGFLTSQFLYEEVQRKKRDTKDIHEVVLLFLSREEREIVNYLVEHNGETTQAEIARLPHMNRVKAHRSLQKMQERQLLEVVPHGKIRRIILRKNILELLHEDGNGVRAGSRTTS